MGNARLIGKPIPTLAIDGTKHGVGLKGVDEGTGAVVDGFAGEEHIVGVHDAVYESEALPMCD